jgi:hypothetical protein
MLRPTVSRSVCPGIRPSSETRGQYFFHFQGNSLETVRRGVLLWGAPLPPTRLRILIYSRCCASPAQYFSDVIRETHRHVLSQFWDSANLQGHVPVFISLPNRVVQLYPSPSGTWFPFCRFSTLAGLRRRFSNRPPHGVRKRPGSGLQITTGMIFSGRSVKYHGTITGRGVYLCGMCPGPINRNSCKYETHTRMEAGENTSTVALRVVRGDEKGTQSQMRQ